MGKPIFDHTIHLSEKRDRIRVREDSGATSLGPRSRLNFIAGTGITLDIVDDATNDEVDITINGSSAADPLAGFRKFRYRAFDDFTTTTGENVATGAPLTASIGAAAVAASNANGSWVEYRSDALVSNPAGWVISSQPEWEMQLLPDSTWRIETPATVTNFRAWIGCGTTAPQGFDRDAVVGELLGFHYSTALGDTNWWAGTSDSSSVENFFDTGVAFAASTAYQFRIKVVSTSEVEFYINDALVATSTANLPASTVDLKCYCVASTLSATNKRWRISYQYWTML